MAKVHRHPRSAEFFVQGTNGYLLDVSSESGQVGIMVSKERAPEAGIGPGGNDFSATGLSFGPGEGNASASAYFTDATAGSDTRTQNAFGADFGALGELSVAFVPSGEVRVQRFPKTGKARNCNAPSRIVRKLGTFSGTIRFLGEDGYTTVDVTNAKGSVGTSPRRSCTTRVHGGGRPAGRSSRISYLASLEARSRSGNGPLFVATVSSLESSFMAIANEIAGPVRIVRLAAANAPQRRFLFEGLSSASVTPPPPFSGVGVFQRITRSSPGWSGSLSVSFPGMPNVPLAGPAFDAKLRSLD